MKHIFIGLILLSFLACKQETKKATDTIQESMAVSPETSNNKYPESLNAVFEAHGGLNAWKKQRTLSYVIAKERPETHTIDLWSRWDRIDIEDLSMGFDGKTWLLDPTKIYKGNPEFYHNLMFYFYAMPFVLADDGINYAETEPLQFDGKYYPGIQITYNSGVGTSPKDEYYIHYNPETFQMEWLGYTVTYRTGEDSDNIKWIRYNDWVNVEGLKLPKSISWYNYEGREIKDIRNTLVFEKIKLSDKTYSKAFYQIPPKAIYYQKPKK